GHIGAAGRIRGDPKAEVVAAPAEVGRVHEPGPARAELRHEGIVNTKASSVRVLECQGSGEVRRVGKAGHICAAGGIHGDTMTFVTNASRALTYAFWNAKAAGKSGDVVKPVT